MRTEKNDSANRVDQGNPLKGVPCPPGSSGCGVLLGTDLLRAGMMLGTLDKINRAGFDGQELRTEIEMATLNRPFRRDFILSEVERCADWCGVLRGESLESAARRVFE